MTVQQTEFLASLDSRAADIVDSCTRCGKCVAVCPMPGLTGIDASEPEKIVSGVLDILRDGTGPEASARWASVCSGTGHCIAACDYGVNPRFMLSLARRALKKGQPEEKRRDAGKKGFQDMSRGVRVLSRLQLPPDLMARLNPSSHPERDEAPDLIFYTGCNMLKTPHIGLLCLDVLDRLGVSYEVYGGPSNCCGVLQWRPGDDANSGRQAYKTIERFAQTKTSEVLSWCPTCQIQFSEMSLPNFASADGPVFDMTMFAVYLERRLDELRPLMTRPVKKRVALHEHAGALGVTEAVKRLLRAIPGLELVDLELPQVGYSLNALRAIPDHQRKIVAKELKAAEEARVTTLAGIYHSDHRELVGHESEWCFEIINFMELIGESMGLHRDDVFKRLKMMRDVDAILADTADLIATYRLDPEEVREVVLKDIIGDQHLPLDRNAHAKYLADG